MEMKLPEQVHQVCRLCGQFESIYIDIFGEEGTRRLLGLKIYNKINILIEENDGLSQVICIQCLGTLDTSCDFCEKPHETKHNLNEEEGQRNDENCSEDSESTDENKENELPPDSKSPRPVLEKKITLKCESSISPSELESTSNVTNIPSTSNVTSLPSTSTSTHLSEQVISRVLADITDQHQQRPRSNLCKELFPLVSRGIKRRRESSDPPE